MNKFEFIKYEPTPNEKHLGIATVKIYDRIIARFKVVRTKDGANFFPAPSSIKIGDVYFSAFELDSSTDKDELNKMIKDRVGALMKHDLAGSSFTVTPPAPLQYQQTTFLDGCPF